MQILGKAMLVALSTLTVSCVDFMGEGYTCSTSSVWLTVTRLSYAEKLFYEAHGRYGELAEMTNIVDGLPPETTSGRLESYTISIQLTKDGYVLRANPDFPRVRRGLSSYYADQTGLITYDPSGRSATPNSTKM
jgi:hypothetical protein